jgi:hypothetical protein
VNANEAQQLALDLVFLPVVSPHPLRLKPWKVKKGWYRHRFGKLNVMFLGFALVEVLR